MNSHLLRNSYGPHTGQYSFMVAVCVSKWPCEVGIATPSVRWGKWSDRYPSLSDSEAHSFSTALLCTGQSPGATDMVQF